MQIAICACPLPFQSEIDEALSKLGCLVFDPRSLRDFDLVICDQDFYLSKIAHSVTDRIPFLVVASGFFDFEVQNQPFEVSGSWKSRELLFRLRAIVPDFSQSSSQGMVEIKSDSIFVNGQIVKLPQVLQSMLLVFLKNQNRVLELSHFMSCFDKIPKPSTNLLTVYVSKLRKKCLESGIHCLKFTSMRRRGYVLNIL